MAQPPPTPPPPPAAPPGPAGAPPPGRPPDTEFLATLAHELRNPLAPLRNGLHVLRHTGDPHTRGRTLAMMDRQVTHLSRLVEDLLDMSRLRAGKLALRRQRVDLRDAIQHATEISEPQIRDAGHAFELDLPDAPLWVDGDDTRLCQVLSNLLNNAARYTPRGGHIGLRAWEEPGLAVVQVRDDGIGIPPEALPRIFRMFAQLPAGGAQRDAPRAGLGIGLALVHALVSLHGGRVTAASAGRGQGSSFTVRLPLVEPPAAAGAPRAEGAEGADGAPPAGPAPAPLRILVVDDSEDAADSLALLLRLDGHAVVVARDGPQALAAVAREAPDVVLLDIGLPGMDGYAVARALRTQQAHGKRPPVLVALTGWGASEDRARAQASGFDHHLTKPADLEALRTLLAGVKAPA
ncbi:hybrid sensor histidine kinase/response regulator [Ramlibacter sp. MAHUQ-53]|uniref:hybrid sensor histidine kinase/response regulator n=1 Tax=unclassified Ramlibacter TaxID=2617605 RepID=UPI003637EB93